MNFKYHQFKYDGPVLVEHRKDWMDSVTRNKFDLWDDVMRNDLMNKGTPIERSQVLKMLQDPTIYTYAFFRDENGNPFKLYSYQDMILNDPNDRIIFAASNQIGKSISLCIKALTYALNPLHSGHTVLMVSKTLPQSKDLLRQIRKFLINGAIEYKSDVGDTETKTEIYFRHYDILANGAQLERDQSRIVCVPATEAALGYAAHLVLVDELAFYENGEYFYKQIIQPRTYSTKGQIILFSNPNGEQGIFYELWQSKRFSKYRFNFLDKPGNTKIEMEDLMSELSQAEIDSTLLAIFTSGKGAFLTLAERKAIQEARPNALPTLPNKPFFVCFDFAKVEDQTVRAVASFMDNGGIFVHELKAYPNGTSYSSVVDDLNQLIDGYGVQQFQAIGWDNTGVGAGIEDFINKIQLLGIPCIPVKFSLENKSRMYTVFKTFAERSTGVDEFGNPRRMISIPYIKECDKQLSTLRFERTAGNIKVHHEKESDRDDFPDVLACTCGLMVHRDRVPADVEIITTRKKVSGDMYDRYCEDCGNPLEDEQEKCNICDKDNGVEWGGIV